MVAVVVLSVTVLIVIFVSMVGEIQCQSNDCTSVIVSLSPCLNYIDGQSDTPTVPCCTQLASVVKSNPECLCEVLDGGGASVGININTTRALELPAACNVTTPPVSECNSMFISFICLYSFFFFPLFLWYDLFNIFIK